MEQGTLDSMRKVDLIQQISLRLIHGFPIAVEDEQEAEALGISIEAIKAKVGVYDEQDEYDE